MRGVTRRGAAGGSGRPRPAAVAAASVATVILVIMLLHQHPQNTSRLRGRLSAAVQSLAQDAELSPGPQARARPFGGTPAIGALFARSGGRLGGHFCTASVVESPHGNLVLTAAHCVSALPPGQVVFVPGYHDGVRPYGAWPVSEVIVDHAWAASADPDDDVAFLVVGRAGHRDLAGVTGAEGISFAEPYGQTVSVAGYPSRSGDPIRCQNQVRWFSEDQLQFDCSGYSGGTSGSPLLAGASPATGRGTVIGVIGGYEQGGDTSGVSYAARFGPSVAVLYRTALCRAAGGQP
jgi:V8-like Glu-specific endopeptidase